MRRPIYLLLITAVSLAALGCGTGKAPEPKDAKDAKGVAKAAPAKPAPPPPPNGGFGGGGIQLGNDDAPAGPKASGGGFGDPGTSGPNYDEERRRLKEGREPEPTELDRPAPKAKTKTPRAPKAVPPGPAEITVMTLTYRAGAGAKLLGVAVVGSPTAPQVSYEWETADGRPLAADLKRELCVFLVPAGGGQPIRWRFNAEASKGDAGGSVGSSAIGDTPPFGQYKGYAFLCPPSDDWVKQPASNIVEFSYERPRR